MILVMRKIINLFSFGILALATGVQVMGNLCLTVRRSAKIYRNTVCLTVCPSRPGTDPSSGEKIKTIQGCLLYTSDAADE